jgi:2-polyprenyl-6-methoxyphenol hydroxylase-like FAD-dependent oxidoreductase
MTSVLIVGGGIGGLATAVALCRRGIPCTVFERAAEFRLVGAAVAIQSNGVKALRAIDESLGETVVAAGEEQDPEYAHPLCNASGAVLFPQVFGDQRQRFGAPTVTIERAELHEILLRALPDGIVKTGHRLVEFEQDEAHVVARFDDGRDARGDLLIGADGLRSTVRATLLGHAEPTYLGYSSIRGVTARPDHPLCQPRRTFTTVGRGVFFSARAISRNRVYWTSMFLAREGELAGLAEADAKQELRSRLRGWHAPIETLIDTSENLVLTDIYDRPPVSTWSRGRAILLGDAAHPTSPNLGQGACMALEDAACLSRSLAETSDTAVAFRRYEEQRIARTTRIVERSRNLGRQLLARSFFRAAMRDAFFRLAGRSPNRTPPLVEEILGYSP